MGSHSSPPSSTASPPGAPNQSYTLPYLAGEVIYIPTSKSVMRLLVTGKETEKAFALVGTGGSQSDPIGFHYHDEAHDVFLCVKGGINVWADDRARTLQPGDFASVPPGTIHQYQILGPHSEFIGLIVPGGWEEFFRFIGEPYSGPMWPLDDNRNPMEVLVPKLRAAAESGDFDMIPVRSHPYVAPQPWSVDRNGDTERNRGIREDRLPGSLEPYFIRNGTGPRYLIPEDGVVISPLATTKESAGKFAIACIEGSSYETKSNYENGNGLIGSSSGGLLSCSSFSFRETHHALQIVEGAIEVQTESTKGDATGAHYRLSQGDRNTIYLPRNTRFTLRFASRYAKTYVFASGAGLVELLCQVGEDWKQTMIPERRSGGVLDREKIEGAAKAVGCDVRT